MNYEWSAGLHARRSYKTARWKSLEVTTLRMSLTIKLFSSWIKIWRTVCRQGFSEENANYSAPVVYLENHEFLAEGQRGDNMARISDFPAG